ncbi:DUF3800 domain-containing protein [Hydrogenimonas sp.]
MYLLYADESGSLVDPNQDYFILSGVAVFERKCFWVEKDLIDISKRFDADDPFAIELHGSPMRTGKGSWRGIAPKERLQAAIDALSLCQKHKLRIFSSVIYKPGASGIDILELAFEQFSSRFDQFLQRCYRKQGDPQRGIIILDKSSTEIQIQNMARTFKFDGHTWGKLRNFSEVPLFIDSRASKLMQLADLIAFALKRHYADNDDLLYQYIKKCFDEEGGVCHGLFEKI